MIDGCLTTESGCLTGKISISDDDINKWKAKVRNGLEYDSTSCLYRPTIFDLTTFGESWAFEKSVSVSIRFGPGNSKGVANDLLVGQKPSRKMG